MHPPNQYMPVNPPAGWIRHCYNADDIALTIDTPEAHFLSEHTADNAVVDSGALGKLGDAAVAPLLSAIALAEREPLLQCVSQWLGKELDWQETIESRLGLPIDITLSSHTGNAEKVGLSFVSTHTDLPEFPPTLKANFTANAHRQPLIVCLSELALGLSDQNRLGPGCCVLLPETFANSFTVSLFNESSVYTNQQASQEIALTGLLTPNENSIRPLLNGSVLGKTKDQIAVTSTDTTEHNESNSNDTYLSDFRQNRPTLEHTVLRFVLDTPVDINLSEWMSSESGTTGKADKQLASVRGAHTIATLAGQSVRVEQCGVPSRKARLIRVGDGFAALFDNDC